MSLPQIELALPEGWEDYELLDSGDGQKLERFGPYRLVRPEPEAVWRRQLPTREWEAAHAVFQPAPEENGGHWQARKPLPEHWVMRYRRISFRVQTTSSRHVGVFPEQASQWDWITDQIHNAGRPLKVLNLFGYTGVASVAAAAAGAQVTHVDASRKVITWANQNLKLSGLEQAPVRWIVDDALKFVQREARRNAQYDGLILDPPKFGRGPKGEVWEFYALLPNLLQACAEALARRPQFVVLTAYAVKASALTLHQAVTEMMAGRGAGQVTAGELVLQDKSAGRLVSTAIYARWAAITEGERKKP